MKVKYLNYQQAEILERQFQFIIGRPFDKNENEALVKATMVAPYSPILQWQFLRDIQRGMDHASALSICKNGRFDIIVISNQLKTNKDGFTVKDLRSYIQEHDLTNYLPDKV